MDYDLQVPSTSLDGGRLSLDLDATTNMNFVKTPYKLNTEGELTVNGVFRTSLPVSPTNDLFWSRYVTNAIPNTQQANYPVIIHEGFNVHYYRIQLVNRSGGRYEVEFLKEESELIQCLRSMVLRDIEVGEFVLNTENLSEARSNEYYDSELNNYVTFPVGSYKRSVKVEGARQNMLTPFGIETLRPFYFLVGLLEKMICQCGYQLVSPLLDTEDWRRKICYLLRSDYGAANSAELFAEHSLVAETPTLEASVNLSITYGYFNVFDSAFDDIYREENASYRFYGRGIYDIDMSVSLRVDNTFDNDRVSYKLAISIINPDENSTHYESAPQIESEAVSGRAVAGADEVDLLLTAEAVEIPIGHYAVFIIKTINPENEEESVNTKVTFRGGSVIVTPKQIPYEIGDTIDSAKELRDDKTCYELLTGSLHLIDGVLDIDERFKTVDILLKEDEKGLDGFYGRHSEAERLSEHILCSTQTETVPNDLNRYHLISFADSSDAGIQELESNGDVTEENPLWSKTIDLGAIYNEDISNYKNPFFEPTKTILAAANRSGSVYAPYFLDNIDGRISYDIGPRILHNIGVREEETGTIFSLSWQLNEHGLDVEGDGSVVYGDEEKIGTQLGLYYAPDIVSLTLAGIQADIFQSDLEFYNSNLKKKYIIHTDGFPYVYKMNTLSHSLCKKTSTATFVPIPLKPYCDE